MAAQARKKWMIFMRESDGTHFLWNGEGCIRVSPLDPQYRSTVLSETVDSPRWHHDYGQSPVGESKLLNITMQSRNRGFTIEGYGRYQVIARGEFRE